MDKKTLMTVEQLQGSQSPNLILAAAIACMSSKMNLEQQKTFLGLIYVARAALRHNPEQWVFSVLHHEFSKLCGLRDKSVDDFIENVEVLMDVKARLNYLNKRDQVVKNSTNLVGDIKSIPFRQNRSLIEFSFPKTIWNLIKDPDIYVTLGMQSINSIRACKYSIPIYSFCRNYMSADNRHIAPPEMTPEFFRDFLHLESDGYANFGNVKKKVIEPAMAELNKISEINIECEYRSQGKKVVGIKFRPSFKKNVIELNRDDAAQLDEIMKLIPAKYRLELKSVVTKHLDKHGVDYCVSNIKYAVKTTDGSNPAVLIKFALEKDYAEPFRTQKEVEKIKKAEETAAKTKKKAQEELSEKEALRQQQRALEIYNDMSDESRAEVDEELDAYFGPKPARLACYFLDQGVSL